MTLAEVKAFAKIEGYNGVETMAGKVTFEDWTPYGEAGKNIDDIIDFTIHQEGEIREVAKKPSKISDSIMGIWPLYR